MWEVRSSDLDTDHHRVGQSGMRYRTGGVRAAGGNATTLAVLSGALSERCRWRIAYKLLLTLPEDQPLPTLAHANTVKVGSRASFEVA